VIALTTNQQQVIEFLSDPASYAHASEGVRRIETHGAVLFLVGDEVYKIKRAVRYPYMDFSSLGKRESACRTELSINKPNAEKIYLDVVPIVREADGGFALNGEGEVIEWAVHMRRFDDNQLLSQLVSKDQLTPALACELAAVLARYHSKAKPLIAAGAASRFEQVMYELHQFFGSESGLPESACQYFNDQTSKRLIQVRSELERRGERGFMVRGHGDLHLGNIVIIDGHPVLFDALEFNESLATVDVLYDLAFLLMDLLVQGCQPQANLILNRYLYECARPENLSGLEALPLFLAVRAGIRSMVARQQEVLTGHGPNKALNASRYLEHANSFLTASSVCLMAVGGLSGTGKTTLARDLAPAIGGVVGAVHLRSDLERKALFGVSETSRLPTDAYTSDASRKVYASLFAKAEQVLKAGQAVIIDAVFLEKEDRQAVQQIAQERQVPFLGFWLETSRAEMHQRIISRQADASDATPEVADRQLERALGQMTWTVIDSSGEAQQTLAQAQLFLKDAA